MNCVNLAKSSGGGSFQPSESLKCISGYLQVKLSWKTVGSTESPSYDSDCP